MCCTLWIYIRIPNYYFLDNIQVSYQLKFLIYYKHLKYFQVSNINSFLIKNKHHTCYLLKLARSLLALFQVFQKLP